MTRQRKKNPTRLFFCSRRCYSLARGKTNLGEHLGVGHPEFLRPGRQNDRFSPFRYFMRKARNRGHETDLDLPYLEWLWNEQEGLCALSGRQLTLPPNTESWEKQTSDPWKPSLDRIDSERGYVRGNVRFVCVIANFAKGAFSDEVLYEFCEAVVARRRPPLAGEPPTRSTPGLAPWPSRRPGPRGWALRG